MKYRVNLHRRRPPPSHAGRKRFGLVVGGQLLAIAALALGGKFIEERVRYLEPQVSALEARIARAEPVDKAYELLLQTRLSRVDWAPKLGLLTRTVPDSVFFTEIRGTNVRGSRSLALFGHVAEGTPDLAPVTALVDSLRADPSLRQDFPAVDVEMVKDQILVSFIIRCRPDGREP